MPKNFLQFAIGIGSKEAKTHRFYDKAHPKTWNLLLESCISNNQLSLGSWKQLWKFPTIKNKVDFGIGL